MRPRRLALLGASAAVLGFVLAAPGRAHKPTVTTFTYYRDVYPIFAERCGSCHRSGGVAPMSLLTYKEAYPWAISIKTEVLNLAMPPWFADERYGEFRHAGGLTATEMNTIVDWCLGGSPEGEPTDASAPDVEGQEWSLGAPDFELSMPLPFLLDADTNEANHEIVLSSGLSTDRHVRAVDFRPGSANIVRSASVYVGDASEPRRLLAVWLPGQVPVSMTGGRGQVLPAGSELVLRLHYKKTWLDEGSTVEDQSILALYFYEGDAPQVVRTVVVGGDSVVPIVKGRLFEAKASQTIDRDMELLALLPKVEAEVMSLAAEAVFPGGSREPLIRLHEPSPDWPRKFWLKEPLLLPSGSRIELTVTALEEERLAASNLLLLDVVPK